MKYLITAALLITPSLSFASHSEVEHQELCKQLEMLSAKIDKSIERLTILLESKGESHEG